MSARANNVPVLMYHHVSPSPGMITTSPARFEAHMAWLRRQGWRTLRADEFAAYLAGEPVPPKSVLITFDDGYLDNWLYAHPVLQRHGMHAVLFVVTGWVHDGPVRSALRGEQALRQTPSHDGCEAAIAAGRSDDVIARWSELQAMEQAGTFEVHSHTHTHTRWDKCSSSRDEKRAAIARELDLSRRALQAHLGVASPHLCWPQGYFDDDYVQAARDAGFRYLYTTHAFGRNVPGGDPEHIYRVAVSNRDERWLAKRMAFASHPLLAPVFNRFKAWKRGLRPGP